MPPGTWVLAASDATLLSGLPHARAAWTFFALMGAALLAPMVAGRLGVPNLVGLVVAGIVLGPGGLGLLERTGVVELLGAAGLLYLMFLVGLELDLETFAQDRTDSLVFGAATFFVPMVVSTVVIAALGYSLLATLLLASCWASHTLLTYPIFRSCGVANSRAVSTSVGATIITDTAALLVLAVVAAAHRGELGLSFWAQLVPSLVALVVFTLWVLPRVARWFFAGVGQGRFPRFAFLMAALFSAAAAAELAGIEAIIGAFLAGLSLNRLVPNGGWLMDQTEFVGSAFLIPVFLVSVGLLIDPRLLVSDARTLSSAAVFLALALGTKLAAAALAGWVSGYERTEIGAMFSLSGSQAAATLAATVVGVDIGLIGTDTVNAVIVVILVTCLTTSWTAGHVAPRLPRPVRGAPPLGQRVLVPIANPETASTLLDLAALLARRDGGEVMALHIIDPALARDRLEVIRLKERTEAAALGKGVDARVAVRIDASPAAGVLHASVEQRASAVVLGWHGPASGTRTGTVFGEPIDEIAGRSTRPVVIVRPGERSYRRLLVVVPEAALGVPGRPALEVSIALGQRLRSAWRVGVTVLGQRDSDELRRVAATLTAGIVVDARNLAVAVRDHASDDDVIVLPGIAPLDGASGVIARVARNARQAGLIVTFANVAPAVAPAREAHR